MVNFFFLNIYFILFLLVFSIIKIKLNNNITIDFFEFYVFSNLSIIILLFIFSYFNILKIFHFFLIFCILILILKNFKKLNLIIERKNIYYFLLLNFLLLICYQQEFIWWDEFSSWGLRTKEILYNNSVFYENIQTNLSKPSGSSLLHYFYIRFIGFDERVIIFSQFSLLIFLIINIFKDLNSGYNKLINLLIFLAIIYFSSFILNYGLFSIYTGVLTSFLFLKILINLFLLENIHFDEKKNFFILIFPHIFLLILLKDFSLFYVVYLCLIYFCYFIILKNKTKIIYQFTFFISSFLLSFIFIKLMNIKQEINIQMTGFSVFELINGLIKTKIDIVEINTLNIYQGSTFRVLNKFLEAITNIDQLFPEFKVTLLIWLIILIVLNLLIYTKNIEYYKKNITLFVLLFFGFFLHIFLLLASYSLFFGDSEANTLASFGRYIGLYLIPYLALLIGLILKFEKKLTPKILILFFFIMLSPGKSIEILVPKTIYTFNSDLDQIKNKKKQIIKISKHIENISKDNTKSFIIINNDDGFYHNFFKLYLYPIKINRDCWSFYNINENKIPYSCPIKNIKEISDKIIQQEYDFLIIFEGELEYTNYFKSDEKFEEIKLNEIKLNQTKIFKVL